MMSALNTMATKGLLVLANDPGTNGRNPFEYIGNYLTGIGTKLAPYAYTVAIIMVIVLGFILIMGSAQQRQQVKSHFKIIIVGLIIVIGAPTIAKFFNSQAHSAFGFQQSIRPLVDFIKIKL